MNKKIKSGIKQWLTVTLSLIFMCFSIAGCGVSGGGSSSEESTDSSSPDIPSPEEELFLPDGRATVAPYTIYNADGTLCSLPVVGSNKFSSLFKAIRTCGVIATTKNKAMVKDAEGLVVFRRTTNIKCWVYNGTSVVGVMSLKDGRAYAQQHPMAYVVNGQGGAYIALGQKIWTDEPVGEGELISGGYTYLMSPQGCASGEKMSGHSYGYGSAYLRLSECRYKDISEYGGGLWNAYAFFNIASSGQSCDLGIGCFAGGQGKWKIVHNCTHPSHTEGTAICEGFYIDAAGNVTHDEDYAEQAKGNFFMVWQNYVVTTMQRGADGIYSGADDLFIEAWAGLDEWWLRVTNLRTNEKWGYRHYHPGMHEGQSDYMRVLLCASYCPVEGNVWNSRDGGYIKDVVYEDVKIAKYHEDGDYSGAEKEYFAFDKGTIFKGYTQAPDCAKLLCGWNEDGGVWKSGAKKIADSNWFNFSSYYDGSGNG